MLGRTATAIALAALLAPAAHGQPASGGSAGSAAGASFPTRQVRIITPFPVGAGPETVVRMVAQSLSKTWGKPVIVENRPGANGFIAIDTFKRGAADGHDLMHLDNVHLSAYPALFKKLPYDPQTDFEPLLPLFKGAFFFTVATNSPYKTVADLIADAKANPGKLRRDIERALAEPEVKERYASFGYELFPATREQFAVFIKSESARFGEVIRKANVSLD